MTKQIRLICANCGFDDGVTFGEEWSEKNYLCAFCYPSERDITLESGKRLLDEKEG